MNRLILPSTVKHGNNYPFDIIIISLPSVSSFKKDIKQIVYVLFMVTEKINIFS